MTAADTRLAEPSVSLIKHWDELAAEVGGTPFTRAGWVTRWHDAFGRSPLRVLVHADASDRLIGVLPLRGRPGFRSSPTNWHSPEYRPLAATPESAMNLLTAALKAAPGNLRLDFVDQQTVHAVTDAAAATRRPVLSRVLERSPYIDLAGSFEDYLAGLDRHTRSELRRRRRKLAALGTVRLDVHETVDDNALEAFFTVEASGWKARNRSAITHDRRAERFYRSIAAWAADAGWLRLGLLTAGDRVVAGDFSLEHDGHHYLLKTGYDEELRSVGPGKLLRLDAIRRAFERGLGTYEFLGTDEPWKTEWTQEVRERHRVDVLAAGAAGRVQRVAHIHGRPVAKALLKRARR